MAAGGSHSRMTRRSAAMRRRPVAGRVVRFALDGATAGKEEEEDDDVVDSNDRELANACRGDNSNIHDGWRVVLVVLRTGVGVGDDTALS